jgi:hypothetical protein
VASQCDEAIGLHPPPVAQHELHRRGEGCRRGPGRTRRRSRRRPRRRPQGTRHATPRHIGFPARWPRVRRCSTLATDCGRSPHARGCSCPWRRSCSRSTPSCAVGRATSAMETRPASVTRIRTFSVARLALSSWPSATTASSWLQGRSGAPGGNRASREFTARPRRPPPTRPRLRVRTGDRVVKESAERRAADRRTNG